MSKHIIEMILEVDDEYLAEWAQEAQESGGPYTADLREWDASDVFRAAGMEIVAADECDYRYLGPVTS